MLEVGVVEGGEEHGGTPDEHEALPQPVLALGRHRIEGMQLYYYYIINFFHFKFFFWRIIIFNKNFPKYIIFYKKQFDIFFDKFFQSDFCINIFEFYFAINIF